MKPTHLWTLFAATPHLRQDAMHALEQEEGTEAKKRDSNLKQKLEANATGARKKSKTAIFYLFYNMHIYECVFSFQYILSGHKGMLVAGQFLFCKIMISQKRQNWNKPLVIQRTAFLCMQSEWKHNLFVYLFNVNADKNATKQWNTKHFPHQTLWIELAVLICSIHTCSTHWNKCLLSI